MRLLNRAQMKAAEDAAAAEGTSYEQLMENAGAGCAAQIARLNPPDRTLLLLCGKGNNAGDAFVAARLLAGEGWHVWAALLCGDELSPLAARQLARLPAGVQVLRGGAPERMPFAHAAVIADGVFGTGFRGVLPPGVAAAFAKANRAHATRVALDIPSGLDCDTGAAAPGTFRAHLTLTFAAGKPGLFLGQGPEYAGEVRVVEIGC